MKKLDKEFLHIKSKVKILEKKLHKVNNIMTNELNNITINSQLECGEEL